MPFDIQSIRGQQERSERYLIDSIMKQRKVFDLIKEHESLFEKLSSALDSMEEVTQYWSWTFDAYSAGYLYTSIESVEQLTPLLKACVDAGFAIFKAPNEEIVKQFGNREYILYPRSMEVQEINGEKLRPALNFALTVTARKCERVKVGTKEVDVFEVVCS